MNEELVRQWMMEHLYGEIHPEDDQRLNDALQKNPELAQEWQDAQAVHLLMRQTEHSDAPLALQDAVQQAARNLSANDASFFRWGRWLTAAVVLVASGAAFLQLNGNLPDNYLVESEETQSPEIAMAPQFKLQMDEPNSESTGLMKIARNGDSNEAFTLATSKGHIEHKASEKRDAEAEDLFRTGLGVYNQAFTKIGDDRLTLLKSAVITLSDVAKLYADQKEWAALAMTLIADSHRALDDIDSAIQTYHQLISSYPESDLICTQARISMVELLLTQEDRLDEVDQQLNVLAKQEKLSDDFASLALTASSKIGEKHPEQAYTWAIQVLSSWPPQHIYHQKAQRFAAQYYKDALAAHSIQPWWQLGPLDNFSVQPEDIPAIASTKTMPGYNNRPVAWDKVRIENGFIDFSQDKIKEDAYRSIFLATHIDSPEPQVVILALTAKVRGLLFVNDELVWKGALNRNLWRQEQQNLSRHSIQCPLKKGRNTILFKLFFPTGKKDDSQFSVAILDTDHNINHDLTASY
ncbi:MAG: hypothetical protein P9L94_08120 [Candidatus Hinthialibacter antarcticus]|nr:hypothetical protein [Candidatus Hinthialibacter antarcticus]